MYEPRPPRPDEVDDLEELSALCFGFGRRPRERERLRRRRRVPKAARIIALDGKPVSHIAVFYNTILVQGARVKTASFGGVCTHPEYRKRGIASELLDACFREAYQAGATLVLISGARGLYRRAQADPAGPVWQAVVEASAVPPAPAAITVRRAVAEDWPALATMHLAEPVRFVRSAAFYEAMVSHGWHRSIWIIEHESRPVAYVSLTRDWDVPHGVQSRLLGEYAGARAALLDALAPLFAAAELGRLKLAFPHFDRELAYLCRQRGMELASRTIPSHTIRLLNLPALMKALRPYLLARLSPAEVRGLTVAQDEAGCHFRLGEEAADLDPARATALVLGGREKPRLDGNLGAVLDRIFPVPVPLPGANYA
jgi:predicted N-acetyltransferase YhbS